MTDTTGDAVYLTAQQANALQVFGDLSDPELEGLVALAKQQAAFEAYTPPDQPRVTHLHVVTGAKFEIPCKSPGNVCAWEHTKNGVQCTTEGCGAWATPGMEIHYQVTQIIGSKP